jgi:hypothetical protein
VTLGDSSDGPGRETTPAFSYPVKRDFDGGLLQRWTFVLTRADALAYLRLRREWSVGFKVALGLVGLSGGVVWGLSPWADKGPLVFLAIESGLIGAVFWARDLMRRAQARRMVPVPRPGVLEEWIDCVAGTELEGTDEAYLSPELIGEVLLTGTHLFIRSHDTCITVPRSAFADAAEADEVANYIRTLSRGPYYFDAPLDDGRQSL